MTTRWPSLLVTALAALLALATSASAECVWVLWEGLAALSSENPRAEDWVLMGASKTVEQCSQGAIAAGADRAARFKSSKREGNQVIQVIAEKTFVFRYLCLPDTVDPRGPKGGK